jgi:hypothetical protein
MSYCRFQNTINDLDDCYEHFGDQDLSKKEFKARRRMMEICKAIVADYGEEDE